MEDYILVYDYTPVIRLSDKKYPMYMPEVRQANPNAMFPIPYRDTFLLEWGYMPVLNTDMPTADVVWEGEPELREDGKWYKTWLTRDFNADEIEFNLQQRKSLVKQDARNVYVSDTNSAINYNLKGQDYNVSMESANVTYLLGCYKMLENKNDPDFVIEYCFPSDNYVDMSAEDFMKMVDDLLVINYNLTLAYYAFCKDVDSKTVISDIQDAPYSFL